MADQAYFGDDEANKERDKAEEIFEKLTSNEFKTKEEVEAALKDDNPQARFHRQRKLLWHLINSATAKIDQNLLKEVKSMVTRDLLTEGNGPHIKVVKGEDWNVHPAFRPHYWYLLWDFDGDKVFQHLWEHPLTKKEDLEADSLYWILDLAIFENYISIFQTLWDHPSRTAIPVDRILTLLRKNRMFDNAQCNAFILSHLEGPVFTQVLEKDEALASEIFSFRPDDFDAFQIAKFISIKAVIPRPPIQQNQTTLSKMRLSFRESKPKPTCRKYLDPKLKDLSKRVGENISSDDMACLQRALNHLVAIGEYSETEVLGIQLGMQLRIKSEVKTQYQSCIQYRQCNESFHEKCYPRKKKLGHLLLINIQTVAGLPPRTGSDIDVQSLTNAFVNHLGFELYQGQPHIDLTHLEIQSMIQTYAKDKCHEDSSCSAVVLMSHGQSGGLIYGSNHAAITIKKDILDQFTNDAAPFLRGKPKLFFFQACRGTDLASAVFDNAGNDEANYKLKYSDMIQVFPNVSEYASVRDRVKGSWFIQALTKVLSNPDNTNSLEIRELLDKVSEELSKFKDDIDQHKDVVQSLEYTVTSMTKKFYFPIR